VRRDSGRLGCIHVACCTGLACGLHVDPSALAALLSLSAWVYFSKAELN
jgi:hypothetical protein